MAQQRFEKQRQPKPLEKLNLNLKPHTVILTCGPSGVGKSYLLEAIAKRLEEFNSQEGNTLKLHYSILASDQFRYQLLHESPETLSKFDSRMLQVSKQAFSLLEAELINRISYPVNQHLIFVDTTGLTKSWREKIVEICKDRQYNVDLLLFNYDDRKDFHRFSHDKVLTEKGVKRFYEDVLPTLEKHSYNSVIKISRHYGFEDINSDTLVQREAYADLARVEEKKVELESVDDVFVIGDVHGCFFTFKKALEDIFGTSIEDENSKIVPSPEASSRKVILCGDLIDKGTRSKEVLKLCLNNQDLISWVVGNHENFVTRCHADPEGHVKGVPQFVIDDYFTSIGQYKNDEEFAPLLKDFVDKGYPFLRTNKCIVTHAPCKEKFLGKVDKISKREQRNISLLHTDTKESVEKLLEFLVKEAEGNYPFHLFGHVATEKTFRVKNKLSLDSAAVCGHGLSVLKVTNRFAKNPYKLYFPTEEQDLVDNIFNKHPEYHTLFDEERVDFNSLEGKVKARIDWACKNKVNYISGTMSPSSQEIAEDDSVVDIESLKAGLDYYKGKGVEVVTLQPKYMGSRCNVYLAPKISDCYMTSRNGYLIRKLHKEKGAIENFRAFFKKVKDSPKIQELYKKYPDLDYVILDGELLPWYALGKGLVEETYKPLAASIDVELRALQEEGFVEALQGKLKELEAAKQDLEAFKLLPETNHRLSKTFETLQKLQDSDTLISSKEQLRVLKESIKKFEYQVDLFGKAGNLDFKPFAILKLVFKDGTEILPDYVESFKDVSSDLLTSVRLGSEQDLQIAESFFRNCVKQELEGVVIKPLLSNMKLISSKQIAPYLKVRNKDYLRLVYGYDYLDNKKKYEKLARKKDNRNKIKVSISEFNIGLRLLQTPYKDITSSNQKYKEILATMIIEEEKEKGLDPRL